MMGSGGSADDRITAAALNLIAEVGLGGITMVGVAEAAGVSRQTLYNHYPDVDSIVAVAIGKHNRESIRLLESALLVVDGPRDKLAQLVRHTVSIGAHAHHAPGIQSGLSAETRAALSEYDVALDRRIREVLQDGIRTGAFRRTLVPDVDAALIRHLLNGLMELASRTPEASAGLAATGMQTVLAAVTAG
jgi:AcrR family transcriptional regulator